MTATLTADTFERFWALGYKLPIPIIPPTAEISPHSTLFKRLNTTQDGRGKTPGIRGGDGLWRGFDWVPYAADEHDTRRWQDMGAGLGVKTGLQPDGQHLIAIDADTLDAQIASEVRDIIEKRFGRLPVRIGRYPKALYLLKATAPVKYMKVEFGSNQPKERVELLTDGRQFVAAGQHPGTGKPYTWPRGEPAYDTLLTVEPEQLLALMADLQAHLPQAQPVKTEGGTATVSQHALRGELGAIRQAVNATPNTSAHFGSREDYLNYGYALKAALPHEPTAALELFLDWCSRWQDGENDPDVVVSDWRRMKPPFKIGAQRVYELAEQTSGGSYTRASAWFQPVELNPFEEVEAKQERQQQTNTFRLIGIDEIMSRPPPVFLVDRHIPETSLGFLYSEPGVGKSFLMLDLALHIAFGKDSWHGDTIRTKPEASVLYLASEGSYGLRNRIKAWMKHHAVPHGDNRLRVIEQTVNFMSADDIDKLLRTVRGVGLSPCLVVVDTVSRALPGADENLQKDMTVFIKACDAVRDAFGCAVIGVHHASKAGGDMRGSTVLRGAGDFVFRLERQKGATIGELACEKQKDAPDGWVEPYRFERVELGDGETSLVVSRAELSAGGDVEMTPGLTVEVLRAMATAWDEGLPWSTAPQSGERRAVRRMVSDFGFRASAAEEVLGVWEASGIIVREMADRKTKRVGLKVVVDPESLDAGTDTLSDTGVFD